MRSPLSARVRSEEGSVVIQVGAGLLVLTMLSAFVVDYGMQLVSRNQAQNAVDAAALAGATALAYDNYSDRTAGGAAQLTAHAVANKNLVWSDQAAIEVKADKICADSYVNGLNSSPILACVEVTASRDEAHGNAIPTVFARLMGSNSVGIGATAVAEAKDANATDCLKPLAIPDRWMEQYPTPATWSSSSTFNKYDAMGTWLGRTADLFMMPTGRGPDSGMTIADQFGTQVTLSVGSPTTPHAWQYLPVQIPGSAQVTGADGVLNNTKFCAASKVSLGARLPFATGPTASRAADITSGLNYLVGVDPGASWDTAMQRVVGSCADLSLGRCGSMSPRIIAVALYDPNDLATASRPPSGEATSVLVVNIVGFFVDSISGTNVTGHITRHPGLIDPDADILYDNSSFLRASMLVQ